MSGILGTNAITQVALVVKDIESAKQKYASFFGIEPPPTVDSGDYKITQTTYKGEPAPKAACKMAFFKVGDNLSLELIEPNEEPSTWRDFLNEKGEGIHHIAFGVKNMNEKLEKAAEIGIETIQRGKYGDASGEYAYLDANADLKCVIELLESYQN